MIGPPDRFTQLVQAAEATGATTKRLEKVAILGAYLAGLSDTDLPIAARFLSGRPFPAHDARTLNIGGAALIAVVCSLAGLPPEEYGALHVRHGDIGDAAAAILPAQPAQPDPPLTLAGVQAAYDTLAATPGTTAKAELLRALLARATPAEARYLIKIATGEMRTGVKESLVEDALARLVGEQVSAVQAANMLIGDIGAVALRVRHDTLAGATLQLFHPLKSMLATPVQRPAEILAAMPTALAVLVEDKYDGVRAQAHKQGDRVELYSRTLDPVTHRFPEIVAALARLPGDFVLDGEAVAYDPQARRCLPFAALQKRLGRKTVSPALLAATPVAFMAFDILYQDGSVLLDQPLQERRVHLEGLIGVGDAALVPGLQIGVPLADLQNPAVAEPRLDALFAAARARGNEGLMVKDPLSLYSPGRRGRAWVKVKRALATLDVVVTAVQWGQGRRHHLLSDYTFAVRDGDRLLNVGKAYSGLTDAELAELTAWFTAHTLHDFVAGRVVEPQIVIEVAFDVVQASPRHKSGYALRFPRIVRLRPDKPVSEINTLADVRALVPPTAG
ncbi:MAG TPA: ATP-dependent DNA ligase [Chloroflexia bacterium]|nr:ATP-dependent DNA ligase [Chloroflexia bacterium]